MNKNVVVIGAGYFSQFHLDSWQRMHNANLAGIVEMDESRHLALSEQFPGVAIFSSAEDALTAIAADIVDIVTPPVTHVSVVQTVLAMTEDHAVVVCQKPFCSSIEEATRLAHNVESIGRKLVVHENFRYMPWYDQIKSLIDSGELGEVMQAAFYMRTGDGRGPRAYLERQPYFQQMQRFLMHETGIHWIDTFRYLFGEPISLYADLRRINPHIAGEDAGFFIFSYASGLRAVFDGNRLLDHSAENKRLTLGEMTIEGSEATLRLDGNGGIHIRRFGEVEEHTLDYQFSRAGFGGDCVFRLNSHIVNHLVSGSPLCNLAVDYLRNLELEELVYQSAESGTRLNCTRG